MYYIVAAVVIFILFTSISDKEGKKTGFSCAMTDTTQDIPEGKESALNIYLMDEACTQDYLPVCADGLTYPNACFAELVDKTEFVDGECTTNPHIPKLPVGIQTSVVKVEVHGPDGWVTVHDGEVGVELNNQDTQLITAAEIEEGTYTKLKITWGNNIQLMYDDGSTKQIQFRQRVWEIDMGKMEMVQEQTRNIMIDIPIGETLQYRNNKIEMNTYYRIKTELETQYRLENKEQLGQAVMEHNLPGKVKELRERLRLWS